MNAIVSIGYKNNLETNQTSQDIYDNIVLISR